MPLFADTLEGQHRGLSADELAAGCNPEPQAVLPLALPSLLVTSHPLNQGMLALAAACGRHPNQKLAQMLLCQAYSQFP